MDIEHLGADLRSVAAIRRIGRVVRADGGVLTAAGLAPRARLGDRVEVTLRDSPPLEGEIVSLGDGVARVMTYGPAEGVGLGDAVALTPDPGLRPCESWIGRVVDAFGAPLDGRPLRQGAVAVPLRPPAPDPMRRARLGPRLATGLSVFDTLLPLVQGQRVGLFAGSGVGKSSLLASLARAVQADAVVFALIGERGRELREFTEGVLGPEGMSRSIIVCATSDQSPLVKRRAAWTAMAAAETLRDGGRHVLLLVDSLTRFAEAHREVALTAGEPPSLRAYPPSTAAMLAELVERAGPGPERTDGKRGDITGIFSVLVAGSDMEEPVADMTRGLLDGHVVLERAIAERGRFPAVDVGRSVSRSLPGCASEEENRLIAGARRVFGLHEKAEPMLQAGLWREGADPEADRAVRLHPGLDAFCASPAPEGNAESFARLAEALEAPAPTRAAEAPPAAPPAEDPAAEAGAGRARAGYGRAANAKARPAASEKVGAETPDAPAPETPAPASSARSAKPRRAKS
ncbi:FliI/YscN family ATPase [uncultured Albimonas sp.]|uniref:FliI/YscN family ATPase n=1 Tax=uncultured Albimonas sp. TaxID=1331701 RepID=UPI0030EBA144|tara:strand:+ start:6981 stop:8531 length:1551 start_codon:yes stop_codon:yes gene_type:complete